MAEKKLCNFSAEHAVTKAAQLAETLFADLSPLLVGDVLTEPGGENRDQAEPSPSAPAAGNGGTAAAEPQPVEPKTG